ncbi:MAG: flavoprotein [Planctomycetota bacterium]
MEPKDQNVLLAVGGGIAAYKSADLCSKLVQRGHSVQVIMTAAASEFLGPATLAALTGRPVARAIFDERFPLGAHIELPAWSDLLVIAPTTADLLAKFANGLADDLLSTLYLHHTGQVLLAPAMSHAMWSHPAVQRNLATVTTDGCHVVGPEHGWLSCRKKGEGRMSDPESILNRMEELIAK